ncbi:hypothetical protein [Saccharothrix australiensis]|uniref:Uncharacterized protein n=1 Tax=Saccharothrix australiensis TaxID=2072 RepID=A0A495VRN6_9PSEU|nr:hypothetical protein [Saccharothrix australiensis]RKT52026.1 hypothetical protein C8E97_0518 [Saccharothrix australiensis]
MSDGNTVSLTQPAPVPAPHQAAVPAADTSTTQVITPDVLASLVPSAPHPVVTFPADTVTLPSPVPPATPPPETIPAATAPEPVAHGTIAPGAVPPEAVPPDPDPTTGAPPVHETTPGATAPPLVPPTPGAEPTAPVTTGPVTSAPAGDAASTGPATAPATAPSDPVTTQVVPPETSAKPSFTAAAQTDLAKATTALDAVDKRQVELDLDKQALQDLLAMIRQARNLVDNVHYNAVNNLDVELQFGRNWVGEAISRRLREVAVGDEASAVSVIGDFMKVLFEVEETIRDAARNLEEADDDAAEAFNSVAEEVKGS